MLLTEKVDVRIPDILGGTSLHTAAWYGHSRVVKMLLDASADVMLQDTEGYAPLHGAALNRHGKIVEMLVKAKADHTLQNKYGVTALDLAVLNEHYEIASTLVRATRNANTSWDDAQVRNSSSYGDVGLYPDNFLSNVTPSTSARP